MSIDHTAMTDCVKEFDELTTDQISLARKVVASNSSDAEDCSELLKMLGIHYSQEDETCVSMKQSPAQLLKPGFEYRPVIRQKLP